LQLGDFLMHLHHMHGGGDGGGVGGGGAAEACVVLRRAHAIAQCMPDVAEADMCHVRNLYCRALTASGALAEVRTLHAHALQTSRARYGDMHTQTVRDMQQLAQTSRALGDLAAAAALYAEAGAALKETVGRFHPSTAHVLQQHAEVCDEQGEYALAEVLCDEAVSSCRQVIGPPQQSCCVIVDALCMQAQLHARFGRLFCAEACLREAMDRQAVAARAGVFMRSRCVITPPLLHELLLLRDT
jgi:hypothetical protein